MITPDMREARRLIERLVECHDWLAPRARAESNCKTVREAHEFLSATKAPTESVRSVAAAHGMDAPVRDNEDLPLPRSDDERTEVDGGQQ